MSRYFIDTEFIERFHKPLFGKARHVIDLISIGIYCEDGRSYHAISKEYKYKDASDWVKENVIIPLYVDTVHGDRRNYCDADHFQLAYGKMNATIGLEVREFCGGSLLKEFVSDKNIKFYGYYSDYDWVVFCSLFGTMMNLPKGFPMYCIDLKQTLDEKSEKFTTKELTDLQYGIGYMKHDVYDPLNFMEVDYTKPDLLKKHLQYPKQNNEHNALSDAKWNYNLYKFLETL